MTEQERALFARNMGLATGMLSKLSETDPEAKQAWWAVLDAWNMLQERRIDWGAVDEELLALVRKKTLGTEAGFVDDLRALLRKVSGQ